MSGLTVANSSAMQSIMTAPATKNAVPLGSKKSDYNAYEEFRMKF